MACEKIDMPRPSLPLNGTVRCPGLQGLMRVRSNTFGGAWVPVFTSEAARKASETHWPVGLNMRELRCIVCNPSHPTPQVSHDVSGPMAVFTLPCNIAPCGCAQRTGRIRPVDEASSRARRREQAMGATPSYDRPPAVDGPLAGALSHDDERRLGMYTSLRPD